MLNMYKSYLVILKQKQAISKDEDLKVLIDTHGQQTSTIDNAQDIICAATIRMIVTVGKMLMENRAMLLPTIHSDIMHYARGLFAAKGMQDPLELKSISSMKSNGLPQILQTLFVCTGCDYVSFFSGFGKVSFLHYFSVAPFISGANANGSLSGIRDYKGHHTLGNIVAGYNVF